ncbi:MAG: hypothetical protein RR540_05360 [Oscillospiraceae bacterium]
MESCKNLDERQQIVRNQGFRHAFKIFAILTFVNALLVDFGIIWSKFTYEIFISFAISFVFFGIEMVVRDACPKIENRRMFLSGAVFVIGAIVVVLRLFSGDITLFEDEKLATGGMISAVLILLLPFFITYFFKISQEKKALKD